MPTCPEAADSDDRDLHPSEIIRDEEAIAPDVDAELIDSKLTGDDLQEYYRQQYQTHLQQRQRLAHGEGLSF
jgi:hypothetical protein